MTDNELLSAISDIMDKKLDSRLTPIESEFLELKNKITGIELTLENEISHNIRIIAEGHLDLSRKLNEAIHLASDIKARQEIQDLLIKSHETKLKIRGVS